MTTHGEEVFWSLIEVLDASKLLPHVMIVGSWSERSFVLKPLP